MEEGGRKGRDCYDVLLRISFVEDNIVLCGILKNLPLSLSFSLCVCVCVGVWVGLVGGCECGWGWWVGVGGVGGWVECGCPTGMQLIACGLHNVCTNKCEKSLSELCPLPASYTIIFYPHTQKIYIYKFKKQNKKPLQEPFAIHMQYGSP